VCTGQPTQRAQQMDSRELKHRIVRCAPDSLANGRQQLSQRSIVAPFNGRQKSLLSVQLGMAILLVGSDIRGYLTRRVRFRVQYFTRGFYPYPTRGNIGSSSDIVLYPWVPADIRKYVNRREVANCGPIAGPTCDRLG
jgi:hypothetical protein